MLARPPYPYTRRDADTYLGSAVTYPWEFAIMGLQFMGVVGITGHLGYWLGKPFWGHSYMTEAAGTLVDAYFSQTNSLKIVSGVLADNPASRPVLRKLGFEETGVSRQFVRSRGEEVDHVDVVLYRARWRALTNGSLDAGPHESD